jgi:hypothetical protein
MEGREAPRASLPTEHRDGSLPTLASSAAVA